MPDSGAWIYPESLTKPDLSEFKPLIPSPKQRISDMRAEAEAEGRRVLSSVSKMPKLLPVPHQSTLTLPTNTIF